MTPVNNYHLLLAAYFIEFKGFAYYHKLLFLFIVIFWAVGHPRLFYVTSYLLSITRQRLTDSAETQ